MAKTNLSINLNGVLELYENDKEHFPLHRFYITAADTPIVKELITAYHKERGFRSRTNLIKPENAKRFLRFLYMDIRLAGFGKSVEKLKISPECVYTFLTRNTKGGAFPLVYFIAMRDAFPADFKKRYSNNILSKSGLPIHMDAEYKKRVSWYTLLNVLIGAKTKLLETKLFVDADVGIQGQTRKIADKLIDRDVARDDPIIFLEKSNSPGYNLISLIGKVYE